MRIKNKIILYVYALGMIDLFVGSYLKINKIESADFIIVAGVLFQTISILMLILKYKKEIISFLKK